MVVVVKRVGDGGGKKRRFGTLDDALEPGSDSLIKGNKEQQH